MTAGLPEKDRPPGFLRARWLAAGALALVVLGLVLYGTRPQGGKDQVLASLCPVSTGLTGKLQPLIHGEIAALMLAPEPKPMPALTFDGPDGKEISLAGFKGRTVLFNLWATWCVPCRQEMPALDRVQGALGSPKFSVVAVNIDTTRLDRTKAFLDETGIKNLTYYSDHTAGVFQALKQEGLAFGLPATILIGKDGCAIGNMAGPAQWDSEEASALLKAAQG